MLSIYVWYAKPRSLDSEILVDSEISIYLSIYLIPLQVSSSGNLDRYLDIVGKVDGWMDGWMWYCTCRK